MGQKKEAEEGGPIGIVRGALPPWLALKVVEWPINQRM